MTLNETINQIYDLTVDGIINGEKFTRKQFSEILKHFFKELSFDQLIFEITLPDGNWLVKLYKWDNKEYDYFLPDTREQEKKLYRELGIEQ